MIHLFLFKDDKAKILFVVRRGTIFVKGANRVVTLTIVTMITILFLKFIDMTSMAGRIFCHVITINMEVCLISIELISFMYHICIGHTPILAKIVATITQEDKMLFLTVAVSSIIIDVIAWIR